MSGVSHGRLQALLERLRCDLGAAESHGILCGMMCGPAAFEERLWRDFLRGEDDAAGWSGSEASALFGDLVEQTRAALDGDDYDFAPLLPADDGAGLDVRAAAFTEWCRGFLSGIGLAGIGDLATLGEDARGFITDLDRFCRIAFADAGGEDDERAFAELVEFTRMGVLVLRAERAGTTPDGDPPPVVH